ncbi:hypothetical protein ACQR1Y_12165 [Bradyrhizobium sp. HKCCYLRH3099]|uniref:hypothetical protein n=1 Tax=unclassified Bradyrhizobium TaxID=2631580 RepID=UPI003EB9F018
MSNDDDRKTVTIHRPTGPRVLPSWEEPKSRGSLAVLGAAAGRAVGSAFRKLPRVDVRKAAAIAGTLSLAGIFHAVAAGAVSHVFSAMMMGLVAFSAPTGGGGGGSYTGPGDTFSTSAVGYYSCAQAWNGAYASSAGSLCDLVDSAAPTTVICTLKSTTSGSADLAGTYCTGGLTPSAKCAAATGGVCNISKVYNQVSPGTYDLVQATAANQPPLTFSSTPTGTLPAINCGNGSTVSYVASAANMPVSQPFTLAMVINRTTGSTAGGALGPSSAGLFGSTASANTIGSTWGATLTATMSDAAWHFTSNLVNGASSAINVDGTETTGNVGANSINGFPFRICRANATQQAGLIAEGIVWGAATTSTDRNNLSINAHSSGRYNF